MLMVGIIFLITNEDLSMAVPYVTMMFSIFSLTTISYDEFDNGMSFLFTLPVNRVKYVVEKYIFGILVCLCGFRMISIFAGAASVVRGIEFPVQEYGAIAATGLGIAFFILEKMENVDTKVIVLVILVVLVVMMLISALESIKIMQKKEF